MFYADLHVHSKFSRATSRDCDLEHLALWAAVTVAVHSLFALGIYLIARGLFEPVQPLGMHFVVVPLSMATGVLPIQMGPFELVLNELYASIPLPNAPPGHDHILPGQGFVVALGYRIATVLIAAVGVCYYLGSRQEVAEVMHEAEAAQP